MKINRQIFSWLKQRNKRQVKTSEVDASRYLRNRTSGLVASARANRQRSLRNNARFGALFSDRTKLRLQLGLILALISVIIVKGLYVSPTVSVRFNGQVPLESQSLITQIKSLSSEIINQSLLHRTRFYFPRSEIRDRIEANSNIQRASISFDALRSQAVIRLDMETPVLKLLLSNSKEQYLIANSGRIMSVITAKDTVSDQLTTLKDNAFGLDPPAIGDVVFSQSDMNFMLTIAEVIKLHTNDQVKELALNNNPRELIIVLSQADYFIKAYLSGDLIEQSAVMVATLDYFKNNPNAQIPNQYIDIRLGERALHQ